MIVLASGSPRRFEILSNLGIEFRTVLPLCEEKPYKGEKPSDYCTALSYDKAHSVRIENEDDIIIAADTVVSTGTHLLGKPVDEDDAKKMLLSLSGKEHKVYTGYTIKSKYKILSGVCRTKVLFRTLDEDTINAYIQTGEPMGKAGAYAIQGKGKLFVEAVNGDYDNVVGLPVSTVFYELKRHFGYDYFAKR